MRTHEKPEAIPAELVMRVRRVTGMGVMSIKRLLRNASPLFYSRYVEAVLVASEAGREGSFSSLLYDPIEQEPEFLAVIEEAGRRANEEVEAILGRSLALEEGYIRGQIHLYSPILQRILREEYGIEWFTLIQMNPGCHFD